MNQTEIDSLQLLLSSDTAVKALSKVFSKNTEENKPDLSGGDLEVGQKYRAYQTAQTIIKASFDELISYKKDKDSDSENNRHY